MFDKTVIQDTYSTFNGISSALKTHNIASQFKNQNISVQKLILLISFYIDYFINPAPQANNDNINKDFKDLVDGVINAFEQKGLMHFKQQTELLYFYVSFYLSTTKLEEPRPSHKLPKRSFIESYNSNRDYHWVGASPCDELMKCKNISTPVSADNLNRFLTHEKKIQDRFEQLEQLGEILTTTSEQAQPIEQNLFNNRNYF